MKKLFVIACTLVLGASLSFAQASQGGDATKTTTTKAAKKDTKAKAHKGGKKGKKSSGATTTPAPK